MTCEFSVFLASPDIASSGEECARAHASPDEAAYSGQVSIPVDPADLEQALADFDSGYLLTTSSPQVKVVTVDPVVGDGGRLRITGPGRGTLANLADNPAVTLVFAPRERRSYTLLVDGTGTVDGEDVVVQPEAAVLHRPRSHADGPLPPDGCGHDCAPLTPQDG